MQGKGIPEVSVEAAQAATTPAADAASEGGGQSPLPPSDGGTPAAVEGAASPAAEKAPEGGAGSGAPAPPSIPASDWRDKRIAQLTAQLKSEREKQVRAGQPQADATPAAPANAPDALIEARARELAAQQEFLRQCDELQQGGRTAYGVADFDGRTNALRQLIDPNNPSEASAWNSLLVAARETGEGPRLLYELGADLNAAQRLLSLPPVRMAVELTKMASKGAPAEAPAEGDGLAAPGTGPRPLPNPVRPVGGRGPSHQAIAPDDPERSQALDMATWMSRRQAQVKERGLR